MNTINTDTLDLIKQYEGLKLKAYPDPGTKNDPVKKGKPWTIGFGTTVYPNGKSVKEGDIITLEEATSYLLEDVKKKAKAVDKLLTAKLNDNQYGAVVSFAYNLGEGNLRTSTLLKKINKNPNDVTIELEFPKWNKANGKILQGLVKRRASESKLYFKPLINAV